MKHKNLKFKFTNALENFLIEAGSYVPDGIFKGVFVFKGGEYAKEQRLKKTKIWKVNGS